MKHDKQFDAAMKSLRRLIELTEAAIEKQEKRGDPPAFAKLVNEQRHNLKVLMRNLRRMAK